MRISFDRYAADDGKHFIHTQAGEKRAGSHRKEGTPAWDIIVNVHDGSSVPCSWVEKGLVEEVDKVQMTLF
ncbi:hypothetical protein ACTHQ4_10265 [Alkalicoccobacillus gibsonii]|uniref:hypothetical protein n=1 Tax=Alkalicoccobacillus gibsonii TaxID=79881 RepID=UPI003F7C44BE